MLDSGAATDRRAFAAAAAATFEDAAPAYVVRWALQRFGRGRVAIACSFGGPSGMALIDMAIAIDPKVTIVYIDTGVLFPETYALVQRVSAHYGIEPVAVRPGISMDEQARAFGAALWRRDPDLCCTLRKIAPQRAMLNGFAAWVTGLRRDQSEARSTTPVVQWDDRFGLYKVNPLARWSERDVWRYVREHDVPYNELHDRGYPSIGCTHCTAPVGESETLRAGRWRGFEKTECGLHGGRA